MHEQNELVKQIHSDLKKRNIHFANAFFNLALYHPIINLGGEYGLDFTNKPVLKRGREWKFYINAITSFLVIGNRENWIILHVDGNGFAIYWMLKGDQHGKAQ